MDSEGPCLGDAPNSIFLGCQRNSEFDQGSRAMQRHSAGPEPRDQDPRNRARWRSAAARARAVASDGARPAHASDVAPVLRISPRSEEHTSELQSLMRISYAVFCLKKKKKIRY